MGYTIIATPVFRRALKRLVRKFPSLKAEYAQLIDRLEEHPDEGTFLGNNCYKIRMSIDQVQNMCPWFGYYINWT